jgi:transposase InsO family protein
MKFTFISQHETSWPVSLMCRVLDVSRSGYYAWKKRPQSKLSQRRARVTKRIQIVHAESRETYGSPRVQRALLAMGDRCSVNFIAKLMRLAGIVARSRRKFKCTTDSRHTKPVTSNLLKRDFSPAKANQAWVTDITYVPTREGWLYLCTVEDLYSRRIIGKSMAGRIDSRLVVEALKMAITVRQPEPGLIVHSDRGSQFCSEHYQRMLTRHGLRSSMSRKGNCYDNAPMESFYRTLKVELVYWEDYQSRADAKASVSEYIEVFYNRRRLHSTLGYVSPVEYELAA